MTQVKHLFFQHKNINQLLQITNQEISKVSQWLDSNKLTLNVSKTNFMIFKTSRKKINTPLSVTIDNKKNRAG